MEEEEEVDIVGGYDAYMSKSEREISYISSGQILSCEYTVHPRWLTDNSDATELWPDNFPKQSSQDEMEMVQDEVVIEEPAPIDFDWCEETSNCGDLIPEHDIPATIEEEVITNSGTEPEDDQYTDSKTTIDSLHDPTSPSSPPVAVAHSLAVSTPKPHSVVFSSVKSNPRSLLKVNYMANRPPSKFRKTLMVKRTLLKTNAKPSTSNATISLPSLATKSILKSPLIDDRKRLPVASILKPDIPVPVPSSSRSVKDAPKFRQTVKLQQREVIQGKKMRVLAKMQRPRMNVRKVEKAMDASAASSISSNVTQSAGKGGKGKRGKKFVDLHGENITINHDVESGSTLEPRRPVDLPTVNRVISVLRNDSDDDLDVDIECGSSPSPPPLRAAVSLSAKTLHPSQRTSPSHLDRLTPSKSQRPIPNRIHNQSGGKTSEIHFKFPQSIPAAAPNSIPTFATPFNSTLNQPPAALVPVLDDADDPSQEFRIDFTEVSPLEKYFHAEFFEGRATKTPERYVKIRNFIVQSWRENQPKYVSKTAVRTGLKHCGDVNCISRIHNLLEQIGAINFGCDQVTYVRPLRDLIEGWFAPPTRNKQISGGRGLIVLETRPRTKSNAASGGGGGGGCEPPTVDANYTVSHEDGTIVLPNVRQQRLEDDSSEDDEKTVKLVKPELQLIKCLRFGVRENPAPFEVSITLSTLMCLQLHSLSAQHEVMGFLGGHRNRISGKNKFSLIRYKPCKTSAQSGTMCEMCPVSQVQQSDSLLTEGYDLLGWFHSHPTFPPNPSRTDVATQADMQLQFSIERDRPFIGFIMSCIDTHYKCMYVIPKDLHAIGEHTVPYELDVEIIKDCSNFKNDIADVFGVIDKQCDQYQATLKKFASYANPLLQQYGYGKDFLSYLNNSLY